MRKRIALVCLWQIWKMVEEHNKLYEDGKRLYTKGIFNFSDWTEESVWSSRVVIWSCNNNIIALFLEKY